MRAEELADDVPVLGLIDPDQDDREITGDSVGPERGGPRSVALQRVGGWPERGIGVEDPAREILEQVGLVRVDSKMVQLYLRLRPRQGDRAIEGRRVAILVGERHGGVPRGGDERREDQVGTFAGPEAHATSEAHDRIEHGARGVRQGPAVDHRHRGADASSAPEESRAVRLELSASAGLALHQNNVGRPDRRLLGRSDSTGREKGLEPGQRFRLDEELGERRMRGVGGRRCQDELGIGCQLELSILDVEVRDRDAAHLGIVFRRDQHLERGRDGAVAPKELGVVLEERHAIRVRLDPRGLIPGRPHRTADDVPDKDVRPPVVARDVLAPSGHLEAAAAAVSCARPRQHHRIAPVGEQMRPANRIVGRRELTKHGRLEVPGVGGRLHFLDPRPGDGDVPRRALLQEQLGGLDDGLRVEPRAHPALPQHGRQRDEGHSLMVRHVGAHDGHRRAFRKARSRIVERLVEAIRSPGPHVRETSQVFRGSLGLHHRGEGGRIGCDDEVVAEPTLEPEAGYSEVRVLVRQIEVAHVVGRLGDPPGNPLLRAIAHLAADDEAIRLVQQAPRRRAHDERRHQVLEHRAGPGEEGGSVGDRRHGTAEVKPVRGGDVALGDRDEAGQPRLGGEEVVPAGIGTAVRDAVADREDLARGIEEEAELRLAEHRFRERGHGREALDERLARDGGRRERRDGLVDECGVDPLRRAFAQARIAQRGELAGGDLAVVGQLGRAGR